MFAAGGNITEAQQFGDSETGRFFMRVVFDVGDEAEVRARLDALAADWAMRWTLRDRERPVRALVLVSGFDHCLVDLLYRIRTGELAGGAGGRGVEPSAGTVRDPRPGRRGVLHLPVGAGGREEQEECDPAAGGRGRSRGALRDTCRCCRQGWRTRCGDVASTSITRSCRGSRAPGPITRRMRAG